MERTETRLPYELYADIIDTVAADNANDPDPLKAIKACSLTCHALLPLCRKYIFESILLKPSFSQSASSLLAQKSTGLISVIIRSPQIAGYVKELSLHLPSHEFQLDYTSSPLHSALQQFTNLRHLFLSGPIFPCHFDWKATTPLLRCDLLRLMYLPRITSISLNFIQKFSLTAILPCIYLETLNLTQVMISGNGSLPLQPELSRSLAPLQLNTLTVSHCNDSSVSVLRRRNYPSNRPVLNLVTIKTFEMAVSAQNTVLRSLGFLECMSRLETLKFSFPNAECAGSFINMVSSKRLKTLRSLELHIDFNDTYFCRPLVKIHAPLRKLVGESSVEKLTIVLFVNSNVKGTDIEKFSLLTDALLNPGHATRVSSLEQVDLKIRLYHPVFEDRFLLESGLRELPYTYLLGLRNLNCRTFRFDYSFESFS